LGIASAMTCLAAVSGVSAQTLPTPYSFASQLDLECHSVEEPAPPPAGGLFIRQLNPVLQGHLPNQSVRLGPLEDVCVPVAKDQKVPSPDAYPFARWVDLACYAAEAEPVEAKVRLSHLNPVLQGLPDESVKLTQLDQVCLPVRKNNSVIPPVVEQVIQHLDFACYEFEEPAADVGFPLTLSHLNPVIKAMGLADRNAVMRRGDRLCVPVAKNNQPVPDEALRLVQWVDFLRYQLRPQTFADLPAFAAPIPLELRHLNPLFWGAPPFDVVLRPRVKLMVPVAKNHKLPPQ